VQFTAEDFYRTSPVFSRISAQFESINLRKGARLTQLRKSLHVL